MSSSLEMVIHGVNCGRGFIRLLSSAEDLLVDDGRSSTLRVLSAAGKIVGFGFSAYEVYEISENISSEDLMSIKEWEFGEKTIEGAIRIVSMFHRLRGLRRPEDVAEVVLEGISAVADVLRLGVEGGISQERYFLGMTPEEMEKHTRMISMGGGLDNRRFEQVPVTVDDSHKYLATDDLVDVTTTTLGLTLDYAINRLKDKSLRIPEAIPPQAAPLLPQNPPLLERIPRQIAPLVNWARLDELNVERQNQEASNLLSLSYIPQVFPLSFEQKQ